MKRILCFILTAALLFSLCSCGEETVSAEEAKNSLINKGESTEPAVTSGDVELENAVDLCAPVEAGTTDAAQEMTDAQRTAITDFTVRLLKQCNESGKNVMISPLSVLYALGMTVNGADGETLVQMEEVLGLSADQLNQALSACTSKLTSTENSKLHVADSIWIKDMEKLQVSEDFLRTCVSYYSSEIYKAPFDDSTVNDINSWVDANTDGMIDKIIEEIDDETVMYLINAIAFDALWDEPYEDYQINEDQTFTGEDGREDKVTLLSSSEYKYLETMKAQGFIRDYKGMKYGFAALLPNEGVSVDELLESLDGVFLANLLANPKHTQVRVRIPEFESEYSTSLNNALKAMGMPLAFDGLQADFTKMATIDGSNISIDEVIHKTYISVDRKGTKAAAVTAVGTTGTSLSSEPPQVYLDRPFIYMIIDNETNIPIFIGTTMHIN